MAESQDNCVMLICSRATIPEMIFFASESVAQVAMVITDDNSILPVAGDSLLSNYGSRPNNHHKLIASSFAVIYACSKIVLISSKICLYLHGSVIS